MRSIYKYLLALVAANAIVSCVDKTDVDNGNTWQQGDTPYYVNLRLNAQSGTFTRAEDGQSSKEDGRHEEHDISSNAGNFALFFDADDKYISYVDLYSVNEKEEHEDATESTPATEATFSCRFYGFADREPKKVLVVVNARKDIYEKITDFPGWNLEEVMKFVWEEKEEPYGTLGFFEYGDKVYFTMTNSTYVDDSGVHCAEPIPSGSITTDESEINGLEPVTIYLERMVSKFNMALNFDPTQYSPVASKSLDVGKYADGEVKYYEYPWALQLLGWGLNGLETQNYLFKNVDAEGDWLKHSGWNSAADRRSYWSVDPHYFKDETQTVVYPWQNDFAQDKYDKDHETWYEHFQSYDDREQTFALKYYPFNHFCSDVLNDGTMKNDSSSPGYDYWNYTSTFYTPENTFVPGMQVDRSRGTRAYELAGTHVLVCARILIDPEGGRNYRPNVSVFRNRVGVCYVDELSLFEDFMNAINDKLVSQTYMYYKYYPWNDDEVSEWKKSAGETYYGETFRAVVGGQYALYYLNENDNKYYELTSTVLAGLMADPNYELIRAADAVNADGKIIPWIMRYDGKQWKPLKLFILSKTGDEEIDDATGGEIIDGNENIDGRRLEFQYLKSDSDGDKFWTDFENNGRDDNDIQSLFYEIWGVADYFRNGLMYYAVPIYAQESNGNPASGDTKVLQDVTAGFDDPKFYYYYGVIRNNWYNFTIHSIGDLGIPVLDVNKPIVPNYLDEKDQVKVDMEILSMHVEEITVPIN